MHLLMLKNENFIFLTKNGTSKQNVHTCKLQFYEMMFV